MGPQRDDQERDGEVEEQVSRLLAEVGRSEEQRMPEDVAGRLEDVLAGLVAERAGDQSLPSDTPAPSGSAPASDPLPPSVEAAAEGPVPSDEVVGVTELASRRRPWAPRLLVAAAAVSVLALGVGVTIDDLTVAGQDSAVTSEAADGSAADGAAPERGQAGAGSREEGYAGGAPTDRDGLPDPLTAGSRNGQAYDLSTPVRLRTRSLRADVQRIADSGVASGVSALRSWEGACVRPELGRGDEWLPVRLDGRPAVLVLRAAADGRRTAEVFECGSPGSPVASTSVDVR